MCDTNSTHPPGATHLETSLLEQHVVPAIGCVTCAFLLLSPMKAILKARRQGTLGDLNPFPWMFMGMNGFAYLVYALMMSPADWYLVGSSAFAFLCGFYYTSAAFRLASDRMFRKLEALTYITVVTFLLIFCIVSQLANAATRLTIIGFTGALVNILMYASPLSTVQLVLRERSAASIHLPLALTATANSLLWASYGFAINEPFLYVPIGMGLLFNIILLMLKLLFFSSTKARPGYEQQLSHSVPQPYFLTCMRYCSDPWARAPCTGSQAIPQPMLPSPSSSSRLHVENMVRACCPICLDKIDKSLNGSSCIELSCTHVLCVPCASKCSVGGHEKCPVCRHPHLLDPSELRSRKETWRYVASFLPQHDEKENRAPPQLPLKKAAWPLMSSASACFVHTASTMASGAKVGCEAPLARSPRSPLLMAPRAHGGIHLDNSRARTYAHSTWRPREAPIVVHRM